MNHLLAQALGKLASETGGLSKIVLPRNLPASFRQELARSATCARCSAIVVGDRLDLDELTPQHAISYRTPEGNDISGVLLVTSEGFAKDLKSLEAFRDVLSKGLPGGAPGGEPAFLDLKKICWVVAELALAASGKAISVDKLANAVHGVMLFLGEAYLAFGNDAVSWTNAYWQHLDAMAQTLPGALSKLVDGHPDTALHVAFLSAGLPRPDGLDGYADRNNPGEVRKAHWYPVGRYRVLGARTARHRNAGRTNSAPSPILALANPV